MDQIAAYSHPFPPPFQSKDHHLHSHHRFQPHHPNSSDHNEQPDIRCLTLGHKRDREVNNTTVEVREFNSPTGERDIITRKPRGRPPGTQSKPKSPTIITSRDSNNTLLSHIMEIADGCDITESMSTYARQRQMGLCVFSGSGTVNNVTLGQTSSPGAVVATLPGSFEILSLSGSFFPFPAPTTASGLTLYLTGGQGQLVGGRVVGPLMASGPVFVMAASFGNASYERLPLDNDESPASVSTDRTIESSNTVGQRQQQQQQTLSDPDGNLNHGMSQNLFNSSCQVPAEAYWSTTHPPY